MYILDGLLRNSSDIQPTEIHADTQGHLALPVFGLAWLLGFELMPRIRNWQDLIFCRPSRAHRYEHIDSLFAADEVDWKLIETHWPDLMRVALSVRAGRISSVTLLRRLGSESRRNRTYRALREVGRAVRTIVLLRYLSEPQLREGITAVTNRVEAFHGFADWLMFGREILAHNDPVHHEKTVKFNELLANSAMYSTALDLMAEVNALIAGRPPGRPGRPGRGHTNHHQQDPPVRGLETRPDPTGVRAGRPGPAHTTRGVGGSYAGVGMTSEEDGEVLTLIAT